MSRLRNGKISVLSDSDFTDIISKVNSYSEALRKIGLTTKGGTSTRTLKERIEELDIDVSHFERQWDSAMIKNIVPLEEILVENSLFRNTTKLKQKLLRERLIKYQCAMCGNEGIWNSKPLTLQLDHFNGIHNDNRLENLRLLCPNCHTQTETYGSKNIKKRVGGVMETC